MHHELFYLGCALLIAGVLVKGGARLGLPSIPFFILAGVMLGPNSPGPVLVEEPDRIFLLATLGLVFLLFHLGLEFSVNDLRSGGKRLMLAGFTYVGLNFGVGLVLGFALGWGWREMFDIAGMIGTSSTAIVTKLLIELGRLGNRETGMILGIIVVEDVFLAFYLALLQPMLLGTSEPLDIAMSVGVAFSFLIGLFILAQWGGRMVGRLIGSDDDELLTILFVGFAVFIAGFAELAGASDAIGALMAGMVVAGTKYARRVERLVTPMRDVFAAIFFFWFGTTIVPGSLESVAVPVTIAIVISLVFNMIAAIIGSRIYGYGPQAAANAATMLVSRGEFELILASLAVAAGLDDRVAPFAALYVFVLAIMSPLLAANSQHVAKLIPAWAFPRR
ncbi:MAG: hypothetical protein JWO69_215 [Thermoleophilia bacterium]|nr:hypothetical protein [Thermoleophilia bacterium]